jgi:uncharacterized protein DUF2568
MVTGLKGANLALTFLLELCVLGALAYWGWTTATNLIDKLGLGVGAPAVAIVVWSLLGAPRAPRRLKGWAYWLLRVAFDAAGALALYAAGLHLTALVFAIVAAVNCALGISWKQA